MKYFQTALLSLLLSFSIFAQIPGGAGQKGMPDLNKGHVFGKVVDELGKPVEFANVVLLKTIIDPASKLSNDHSKGCGNLKS